MSNIRSINRIQHISFLKRERMMQWLEFEKKLNTQASVLRDNGELYLSQYAGIDEKRGMLVLRFSSQRPIPRKNEQLIAFIPQSSYLNPSSWTSKPYKEIRGNPHRLSEVKPIWFKYDDQSKRYTIGFSGAELSFASSIPHNTPVILGPEEPPLEYLDNLASIVQSDQEPHKVSEVLDIRLGEGIWRPQALINNDVAVITLNNDLSKVDDIIVQGPPGTGKTFLMASLCSFYLEKGKTVLVTALTNRALEELACKKSLKDHLKLGRVFKMNLTTDEKNRLKGIEEGKHYLGLPGTMQLATYYSMSQMAINNYNGKLYDVVMVEEASQAFLSTIAAARKLGLKCIIIGDRKQLKPIVSQQIPQKDTYNIQSAVEGLNTVCNFFPNTKQYLLTNTFRLNKHATELTNIFYEEGRLTSTKGKGKPINISSQINSFFPKQPGVRLNLLEFDRGAKAPFEEIHLIAQIVISLCKENPQVEIAVLSFYRETIRELQKLIYPKVDNSENVSVETIDRIQGMTTDICIYFIPFVGFNWSLQTNRFNVATSRAKEYTLIFCHNEVLSYSQIHPKVKEYIDMLL